MEILFALMHNLNLAYVELNEVGSWLSFLSACSGVSSGVCAKLTHQPS